LELPSFCVHGPDIDRKRGGAEKHDHEQRNYDGNRAALVLSNSAE
jgi:hypothetical protein